MITKLRVSLLFACSLALSAGSALAQPGGLVDAIVTDRTEIDDPAAAVSESDGGWIAFVIPALSGTRSPCCWKGHWNRQWETGCSLEQEQTSFGTRSDSPLTDNIFVYARTAGSKVAELKAVGESCPVYAEGQHVTWIGDVGTTQALDWLEAVAVRSADDAPGGSALYALALHRAPEATKRLYSLASESGQELADESVFWLGETRGNEGLAYLQRLLEELPRGDTRREINFALSQNGTPTAIDRLVEISRTDDDPEQRSGALFWLAEEAPERALPVLTQVLATEIRRDVLEEAIFAVSQLPAETGTPMLLDLAKDTHRPAEVRRQALFWLANSDDDVTVDALVEMLTQ